MKSYIFLSAIVGIVALISCETDCPDPPECPTCELEDLIQNTEWGEKVKAELISLFFDIEDLALVRVYNTTGDILHWSGFDAGDPMTDSRQIQVDFLEVELLLVWKRFVEGHWTHSVIRINYDAINTTVLQNVRFVKGGQVVRRANNVLFYVSDELDPFKTDGSKAQAVLPEGLNQTGSREIFRR